MAKLILDGFDTIKDAKEYAHWFTGQGEQDACIWMDENNDGRHFLANVGRNSGWIKIDNENGEITIYVYNPNKS